MRAAFSHPLDLESGNKMQLGTTLLWRNRVFRATRQHEYLFYSTEGPRNVKKMSQCVSGFVMFPQHAEQWKWNQTVRAVQITRAFRVTD